MTLVLCTFGERGDSVVPRSSGHWARLRGGRGLGLSGGLHSRAKQNTSNQLHHVSSHRLWQVASDYVSGLTPSCDPKFH